MIYIYVLKCPLSGRPRYVGKTQNPDTRLSAHICKAKTGQTQHHCANWIRALLEQGLKPIFEVIFEVPAGDGWQDHEKRLIAEYLSEGFELTNLTGGGGGFYKANSELLARRGASISQKRLEPEYNAKWRVLTKSIQNQPATKAAKSESMKAIWSDEARRLTIIEAMNTEAARQRRAEATRKRNADPEFAEAHKARMKALFQDPVRKEQLRLAIQKRWADHRARKNEAA